MTQAELFNLLRSTGLPVAYNHFKSPQAPPYIVYLFSFSNNFGADNKVHAKINNYQVELYSDKKDIANEFLLENIFDENNIFYDKSETYIESEEMYQILYLVEV